jgi:hypothetical protein
MELPTNIKKTMYVYLRTCKYLAGEVAVTAFEINDAILLTTFDVDIDIPKDIDIKKAYVASLEKRKEGVKAKYHMELKEVQDEIDNLLAIEDKIND